MHLFDAWKAQRATTREQVQGYLDGRAEAQQLEYLRLQIEMRVLGLGWQQFATRWSSNADARIGTVAHLKVRALVLTVSVTLRYCKPNLNLDPNRN